MMFVCILCVCDQLYGFDSINFPETVWSKAFFIIHIVIALIFCPFLLLSSSLLISLYEVGVFMTHQIRVLCGVWVLKGPHAICSEVIRARLPKKWVHISHIEVNTAHNPSLSQPISSYNNTSMQENYNYLLKNTCKAYDGMQTVENRDQSQDLIQDVNSAKWRYSSDVIHKEKRRNKEK